MIALSWSRLSTYLQCPRQFKAKYVDKDYPDEGDNPYFVRGNRLHKQMEDYINYKRGNGEAPVLGVEAHNTSGIVDNVFNNYDNVWAEQQMAANQEWVKCGWFDKPTVVKYRAIIDCIATRDDEVLAIDFKTGKVRNYGDDHGQLHLTATMLMGMMPHVEEVKCTYLFMDHKQSSTMKMKRSEYDEQKAYFDGRHEEVNADEEFAPLKNQYCNFCLIKEDCPVYRKK